MEHTPYKCPPDCEEPFCIFCQGGLVYCTVCGGGEGELLPECPGRRLTAAEHEENYRRGGQKE